MFLSLLFTGCARLQVPAGPEPDPARILTRADRFWQQGDTHRAEELYARAVDLQGLSRGERLQAWQGLARAAQANEHWGQAMRALDQWVAMDPDVRKDWAWQSRHLEVLWVRDREAWLEQAAELIRDKAIPWAVQVQTTRHVAEKSIQVQRTQRAWQWLERLHGQAPGHNERQELENQTLDLLRSLGDRSWQSVVDNPPREDTFAFFVLRWVETLRDVEAKRIPWPEAGSKLRRILSRSELAISDRLRSELNRLGKEYGPLSTAAAVLCPLSGDFAQMGWKIALGASVAQWQLELAGEEMDLYVLNTGQSGWIQRLEALPEECRLIGGPLSRESWERILESSLLGEHTFFPFRSTLSPGREGVHGFRFFPGTQDQIRPLIRLMHESFGIQEYAVLHPNSEYGYRLCAGFEQAVERGYGRVGRIKTYDSRSPGTWKQVVAELIKANGRATGSGGEAGQRADFQAVFLPDSFSQAQMLIPEFLYFDQDQLFFLGPILWSQGLNKIAKLDRKYFRLALMTTPWLPDRSSAAAGKLRQGLSQMNEGQPDFWVALGYDFVRLAHRLGKSSEMGEGQGLAPALSRLANFSWSMAPLSWDGQGRARQELFVVQPAEDGLQPVVVDELKRLWEAARSND